MKFSLSKQELIWTLLLLPHSSSAGGNSESSLPVTTGDIASFVTAADDDSGSCLGGSDFQAGFRTKTGCTYEQLDASIARLLADTGTSCAHNSTVELAILLGKGNETVARGNFKQLCSDGWDAYVQSAEGGYPWSDVSGYPTEWDKEYYDGHTEWNEEHQTNLDTLADGEPANVLSYDARRVRDLFDGEAQRKAIEYPEFIDNFEQCDLRSVMCCWVSDRQANDNNGNCATPYDERCTDADPADNTDLCAVDMERSTSSSAHVEGGFALFDHNDEGPVHCHGLAWGSDAMHRSARFRGNNLFYVSMYDHMYQRGYVRSVPGAPMCGCVNKMPIVSRSDCTEIRESVIWTFSWSSANFAFTGGADVIDINFNACQGANGKNNDLRAYYKRLVQEELATQDEYEQFQNTVVGDHKCPEAINNLLAAKGYEYDPEPAMEGWTQVLGSGALVPVQDHLLRDGSEYTKQGGPSLRHLEDAPQSPVFYVKRWCVKCSVASHREIIYKRLTAIPEDLDFHDLFADNWRDYPNNTNLLDFTLHSSMEDALEDKNPWSFCNYNHNGVGFPRDCGPYNYVGGQWNSLANGWGQRDVAFYVWNENPSITTPAKPYPNIDGVFGEKQAGFCLDSNSRDQNTGVYRIQDFDVDTVEEQEKCLLLCAAFPGYTGCEAIWGQGNRGCYVHTQEVVSGNGADRHACWIAN